MIDDDPEFIERRHTCDLKRREDMDYLAAQLAQELQNRIGLSNEVHQHHHQLVQTWEDAEKKRGAFVTKLLENAGLLMFIGCLGVIGSAIWEYFKLKLSKL